MKIIDNILNLFRKKEIHIEPSSLTEHNINKGLQYENAELKAERDKLKTHIARQRQSKSDKEEEYEVKLELNKKKEELQYVKSTRYFSLGEFFKKYLNDKKFARKIHFTDFDRNEKLDKFKDFGFSEDGQIVIVGKNGVLMKMQNLQDIFQSVRGLNVDTNSGRIPLNLDSDGTWIENVMEYEIPEIQRSGMGIQYYKARKKPLYEIIAEKNRKISELRESLEEQEELSNGLQMELDKITLNARLNQSTTETLISEKSKDEESSKNIMNAYDNISKRFEQQLNKNIILEDNIDKLERELNKVRDIAEKEKTKDSFNNAMDMIQKIRSELVQDKEEKNIIVNVPEIQKEESNYKPSIKP